MISRDILLKKPSILFVEDDSQYATSVMSYFSDYSCYLSTSISSALTLLKNHSIDLALVDIQLGSGSPTGKDLIPFLQKSGIPTVILSGSDDNLTINECYDLGCFEFIKKGEEGFAIPYLITKYLRSVSPTKQEDFFNFQYATINQQQKSNIIKSFSAILTGIPISIFGETGTGKSHLARALHLLSGRSGEFHEINCANLSPLLAESELFGHEKGSFTGAHSRKTGLFLKANKGTIFLDEIASLDIETQAKLLKAIEEKEFYPVGATKPEKSDFQIISASNISIEALVEDGKFRSDLYFRINGVKIDLLPLRERKEDILPLVSKLLKPRILAFSDKAKDAIINHNWLGNIRELQFFLQNLTAISVGRVEEITVLKLLQESTKLKVSDHQQKDIYDIAVQEGLDHATAKVEGQVFKRAIDDFNGSMPKIIDSLKISKRKYYALLNDHPVGGSN
ncbi:MAG: sigma-54 dependent transcriptional regulator [Bacteriovoracaceae bacterium]|nr:sigma-54 dependent transcriptional regulator [Bacteriovoracaceae bacterium]